MDYGQSQINENWGSQQTPSTPAWPHISEQHEGPTDQFESPFSHSDDNTLSSDVRNSPPQYSPDGGGMIAHSHLISRQPGNYPTFAAVRANQLFSSPPTCSFSYPDRAFYGQLPLELPSPTQDYFGILQRPSRNDTFIASPSTSQRRQPQSTQWSPSPPLLSISPETPLCSFGYTAIPRPAAQESFMSSRPVYPPHLQPPVEAPKVPRPRQSIGKSYPASCSVCWEIIRDQNLHWLHYWTKHPPLDNSPDAWISKKCLWKGCRTKTDFATPKSWVTHVSYVHQKVHMCPVAGCLAKAFGSTADVTRHYLTKHSDPIHCTKAWCQAKNDINLSRKDKLKEHRAMWHGNLMCDVPGCPRRHIDGEDYGFSDPDKLAEHKAKRHRDLSLRKRKK
jgi:hypothetical protein